MKPHHNQYKKSLKYNELLKVFILPKEYFTALEKVHISLSRCVEKNKIYIANKEGAMILTIKKTLDIEEIEWPIELEKKLVDSK